MCNCSKPITLSECQQIKEFVNDPLKRFFIYNISDTEGLRVALVPKEINPNEIAIQRGFITENGEPEWYNVAEHICLNEL